MNNILSLRKNFSKAISKVDVEILLASALGKDRVFLYAYPEYELNPHEYNLFEQLIKRRIQGEPIAYILNKREFWSLELYVDQNVLIPRHETELIVELALELLNDKSKLVADLGTGSGAIALALAKERVNWSLVAVDKSIAALNIAKKNAALLKIDNLEFIQGDWCEPLAKKSFSAIISNPPYINSHDPHLQQGDVRFEPESALVATSYGMGDLHNIIAGAQEKLISGGLLILEHGYDQGSEVRKLMEKHCYQQVTTRKDFGGNERATYGYSEY